MDYDNSGGFDKTVTILIVEGNVKIVPVHRKIQPKLQFKRSSSYFACFGTSVNCSLFLLVHYDHQG